MTHTTLPTEFPAPEEAEQRSEVRAVADEADGCASSLTGEAATTCRAYTSYTHYLYGAYYLLQGAATVIYQSLSDKKLATEVWDGIGVVDNVISGMCNEFDVAIVDLNAGQPFTYLAPPSTLPDFPPPPASGSTGVAADAVQAVWGVVSSALSVAVNEMADGSALKIALAGFLENGQKAFTDDLQPLLEEILGSTNS